MPRARAAHRRRRGRDAGDRRLRLLRDPRLCYAGRISFGLYIYHPIVFGVVGILHHRLGIAPSPWVDTFKAFACFGVAALSWRFIEQPILALKDRLPYREGAPTVPEIRAEPAGGLRGPHGAGGGRATVGAADRRGYPDNGS